MVTGPYHAIASLYGVIENHSLLRQRVINSKKHLINKYKDIARDGNQPLLCTYLEGRVVPIDDNVVLYSPRSELSGSVVCHLGEIHHDVINIDKRIKILC
jgi:2-aminoethylphosphonate-pyruvate transaminase